MEKEFGHPPNWLSQPWFATALYSPHNNKFGERSTASLLQKAWKDGTGGLQPYEVIGRYHHLLHDCLAHQDTGEDDSVMEGADLTLASSSNDDVSSNYDSFTVTVSTADDSDLILRWPIADSVAETISLIGAMRKNYSVLPVGSQYSSGSESSGSSSSNTRRSSDGVVSMPSWVAGRLGLRRIKLGL